MKLQIFGCSLSHGIWWDRFLPEHNSQVHAIPAGDNTTQTRRFQDLVLNNGLGDQDLVLWEVTYPARMGFRLHPNHHFVSGNKRDRNLHSASYKNILDGQKHLDYVAFNKEWYDTFYYIENVNQELQQLLYNIKIADQLTKKKTVVWFAQQDMFEDGIDIKFMDFLNANEIDHVPLENSIMTWAKEHKVAMDNESLHPTPISYKLYVDNILKPKIDENIKRNS